jgi:hypothetical protein
VTTPIARHVDEILTEWYSNVSRWQPPGFSSNSTCVQCVESPFSTRLDLGAWPHDITHPLVVRLTDAVESMRGLDEILVVLDANRCDILDVLEQCVLDRLSRYLRGQSQIAVNEFEMTGEWDRSTLD